MKINNLKFILISILFFVTMILTGCGGGSGSSKSTVAAGSTTVAVNGGVAAGSATAAGSSSVVPTEKATTIPPIPTIPQSMIDEAFADSNNSIIIAEAGDNQTVTQGDTVYLDASKSNNPAGIGISSYEWKEGAETLSNNPTCSKSNFSVGTHTITLIIVDHDGKTAMDTVVITVNALQVASTTVTPSTTVEYHRIVYRTITSPYTGKLWLDRNLGARQVCTALDDIACYGDYYQWGRGSDGHQIGTSAITNVGATDINNAGAYYIINGASFSMDWTTIDTDGALRSANWSKTDGTSICPVGYRVPTITELIAETTQASTAVTNNIGAFNSFLKLPSAGYRNYITGGSITNQGGLGYLWSIDGGILYFYNQSASTAMYSREIGASVRCIKD